MSCLESFFWRAVKGRLSLRQRRTAVAPLLRDERGTEGRGGVQLHQAIDTLIRRLDAGDELGAFDYLIWFFEEAYPRGKVVVDLKRERVSGAFRRRLEAAGFSVRDVLVGGQRRVRIARY